MTNAQFAELAAWITEAGLAGRNETTTLTGFCERAVAVGLPLARTMILADTLHPMYEGRAFRWNRQRKKPPCLLNMAVPKKTLDAGCEARSSISNKPASRYSGDGLPRSHRTNFRFSGTPRSRDDGLHCHRKPLRH